MSDLNKQIKVTAIVSSYPEKSELGSVSSIGSIAHGAAVNNETTKQFSNTAYLQGKFFKSFSTIDFNSLKSDVLDNGDEIWSYKENVKGVEHFMSMQKSNILGSVALQEVKSQEEIDAVASKYNIDPNSTYIIIDGKKYFVKMNIPLHFGSGSSTNVIMDLAIFVFGTEGLSVSIAAIAAAFGIGAFKEVLTHINTELFRVLWSLVAGVMKLSYTFLQVFVGGIISGEGIATAFAAGQAAVGEAIAEGVFSSISATALAYTVVGIIVIAAIFIILNYILHYSYQNIYIYNLTKYDLDFDYGYIYEGNSYNFETTHLPARESRTGPNNIDLGSWYSATAFRFQSDSQFHGLGYALSIQLKDSKTQNIYKKLACMFDIPFAGNNSLRASATYPDDIKSFYLNNEGVIKSTEHSDSDGDIEIIVTYDYLSGQHIDPETEKDSYLYNSLIIIRERGSFSVNPCAKLQNNGYLSIPSNNAYLFGKGDFTLEAWIKPSSAGTIIGKKSTQGGSSLYAGLLLVLEPDGSFKLATDNGFGYYQIISVPTIAMNNDWHHIAAIRSNGTMTFCFDGIPLAAAAAGSLSSPLDVNNGLDLQIGSVQQNQEPYIHYSGGISEVRIWNKALSASDIHAAMNVNLNGNENCLVGYWPLHGNGKDISINKNDANIIGSVVFQNLL